jgi:DNA-binding response OmpR family regulator
MKTNEVQVHLPVILIIDDNAALLALYTEILQSDHHVLTCSNSQDATGILAAQSVQLVILEPAVAGQYGWELLRTIIGENSVPVIVCSALDDRKSGLAAGAVAYLVKPVLPTTLREVVKSILG